MDHRLSVRTNSAVILDYLTTHFKSFFRDTEAPSFAHYFLFESTQFEKLHFPSDAGVVWTKQDSKVFYQNGIYYGIYHGELVKGIYNTKTNVVTNLLRDPTRYFNIFIGVVDHLFAKALLAHDIFRLHAACVSKDNQALLICGANSTGKTTLLLKLLQEGFHFVSDDSVYLQFQNDRLICIPFPKTIIANFNDITKFPGLYHNLNVRSVFTSYGTQKAVIYPAINNIPVDFHQMPVHHIIVSTISEGASSIFEVNQEKLKFDLLFPSCSGKDLLNIDYIKDPEVFNKQSDFCQKVIELFPIKVVKMGSTFIEIKNIGHLLKH
ncbi:MAG: hypothetical protein LUQ65_00970 [Candidatus Helarchaeota archaeon]|nr:hypothetical protein [Candidatus Helarchaeota archaeon]